jgi:hypothetical protein
MDLVSFRSCSDLGIHEGFGEGLDGVWPDSIGGEDRMKRICVAPVAGVLLLLLGCREPYSVVPIASQATISKDWKEFRPAQPLRWSQPVEEVGFKIDTPHGREGFEIIGLGGERFVPEVEVIGESGRVFRMDSLGFLGEELVFTFKFKGKPSDLKTIQAVRLRSSTPLSVSSLQWRGYDPQQVKQ